MFPVLSDVIILDGRALVLALVVVAGVGLLFGVQPVIGAAQRSLALVLPLGSNARPFVRSGLGILTLVAPVAVSAAVLAGTTFGVRRVITLVLSGPPLEHFDSAVVERSRAMPAGVFTNMPPSHLPGGNPSAT